MISNEKGFVLLETIIVLLLISIITVVVMPKEHIVERLKLKSQAQQLAADMRYTQKLALSNNQKYVFKVIIKDNIYFIRKATQLTGFDKKVCLCTGVKFYNFSTINFKYTAKGTPCSPDDKKDEGAGGTITLLSEHYSIDITIRPASGRVRVYEVSKH